MKNPNQSAVESADEPNKKVAPSPLKKAGVVTAIMLGTVAGALGLGKAGEADRQSEELTRQNNEYILDQAEQTGSKGSAEGHDVPAWTGEEQEQPNVDPASKEQALYENSEAFANNDGSGAVKAEREAGQPEAEIGDALAVVKGSNGEDVYVDPATGEPLPEQPKG